VVIYNFNGKNQYIIETSKEIIFQSYDSVMFSYNILDKTLYFNTCEDNYTNTTSKYLGLALEYLESNIDDVFGNKKILELIDCKNRKQFILSLPKGVMMLYD